MIWAISIIAAYIIGSIPFGVIIGRCRGIDIREHGSRNIGATNVTRVLGRKLGLLCFGLDVLKGTMPVMVAGAAAGVLGAAINDMTSQQMWLWLAVAAAAVIGHMFSMFLGFRGGKGVATGFGAMLGMWPLLTLPALAALLVWYVTLRALRYVSIASILAALSIPLWYLAELLLIDAPLWQASPPLIGTLVIALLVLYQHRGNLARIRQGMEPRAGGNHTNGRRQGPC